MADKKPKMSKRGPGGKRTQPKRTVPKSGETRTRMLMSNPPIRVRERKVNGRWVEISRQKMPKSSGTRKPVMRGSGTSANERRKPKMAPQTTRNGMILRGSGTSARENIVRPRKAQNAKSRWDKPGLGKAMRKTQRGKRAWN